MLKPLDFHNTEFTRTFRGYNEEEVDEFVTKIVSHYESLYQENKRLQEEIQNLQEELQKKQSREQDVLDLISLTKQAVSEIRDLSTTQSEAVVKEAKLKAAQIVAEAEARLKAVKSAERIFKQRMRTLMESIWSMVEETEFVEEASEKTKVYRDAAAALSEDLTSED
ncbi:MAG: DivIVA domain-containing protein [Firmicutes bacterium]|nr:DivIVA domain-containing protein [Bacillota bacterium]